MNFLGWLSQNRFLLLLASLLLTLVLPPVVSSLGGSLDFLEFLLVLNLLIAALGERIPRDRRILLVVIVAAALVRAEGQVMDHRIATTAGSVVWLVLAVFTTIGALRFSLVGRNVDREHICAALSVYLLAAHFYGFAYWQLELAWPGSFHLQGAPALAGRFDLTSGFYLSFVTIATLGFGDLVPATPLARGLVVTEAVLGQFYMAVMVAKLVGLYAASGQRGETPSPPTIRRP